jgi:hypothetical protein
MVDSLNPSAATLALAVAGNGALTDGNAREPEIRRQPIDA